jgi:predicted  nucleic acid-binding Zn-ribbon protein
VSKDASTYDHFLEVAAGLGRIAQHIRPLQEAVRRDDVELQRMQNVIDDLRGEVKELESQIEGLRDELEAVRKGGR